MKTYSCQLTTLSDIRICHFCFNMTTFQSKNVEAWFDQHEHQVIQSPDSNPIENVWGELTRQVSRERPANKNELLRCLFRCWGNLTTNYIQSLYRSLPRRVRAFKRNATPEHHRTIALATYLDLVLWVEHFTVLAPDSHSIVIES